MFSPESFRIQRQCTPFCEARCKYSGQHHKILVAVINCVDERGYNNFTKTVTKFIRKGWNVNNPIEDPYPEFRYPLIHWATVLGNVMVLKWCVERGVDLNRRWGQRSETALHRLMVCGYSALKENSHNILKTFKKIVKLLSILLHSKDDNKDLPIHVAAKVLIERPLMNDSKFGLIYTEMLKILIEITCDSDMELLNCRNIEGNTVMHIVAQHDKGADVLELLIENGADCDLPNSEGLKPIDIARAKDATDIITVLANNNLDLNSSCSKEDLGADEIGDIETIYIESDDDMGQNNNTDEKDEIYITKLIERARSETDLEDEDTNTADDTNDPDWNTTDLDASSSRDTVFTIDEDSYDIDGPFAALNDASSTLRGNESSSICEKDKHHCGKRHTPGLKRKSPETGSQQKIEMKKLKTPNVQVGKESVVVSPKLEIQLNMPKFKSLKRKIKEETTQGEKAAKTLFRLSPDLANQTPEIAQDIAQFASVEEVFVQQDSECSQEKEDSTVGSEEASFAVGEELEQDKELFPATVLTSSLPGMCTDDTEQLMNVLSTIKEPLTAQTTTKNMFPSSEIPDKEIHHILSSDEEDLQRSFSSSAEIRSAWQRLHGKITGRDSVKVDRGRLSKLFDTLKPVGTEGPIGTSTPSPLSILQRNSSSSFSTTEQDTSTSGDLPTEHQLPSSCFQTIEQQRSSSSPILSEQRRSNQCPSSLTTDHNRSKKRIEDVISNLKERQRSRRASSESSSSTESVSIQEQANGKEFSMTEQQATTNSLTEEAMNNSNGVEGSNNTPEEEVSCQAQSDQQKQLSGSSVTRDDEVNNEGELPRSELQISQNTKKPRVPDDDVVIKKEIDDSECCEKLLDGNATSGQRSSGTCTSTDTSAGGTFADTPGDGTGNSTDTPGNGTENPTDTSAGGTFTDTSGNGTENSTDTPGNGTENSTDTSGNGTENSTDTSDGGTYQSLSSLTSEAEKLCQEVHNVSSSSSTTVDYDPLYSVIDKFCEEVYGISSGPRRNIETKNETSKQASQTPPGLTDPPQRMETTPEDEQGALPVQTTTAAQEQSEAEMNIKIKEEPGLENTQKEEEMITGTQSQRPNACQVQLDTIQGQMVSVQSQPTLLSATQPTQNIVENPAQGANLLLVKQPAHISVQSPAQPLGLFTTQGSQQTQVATQGQSHVTQPQLIIQQPATQGWSHLTQPQLVIQQPATQVQSHLTQPQLIMQQPATQVQSHATQPQLVIQQPATQGQFRLQHPSQIPGTVRVQQAGVQGYIPLRQNLPALQNNPALARMLHRHFPGMLNRLSRKITNPDGRRQQNVTRPPHMMRPPTPNSHRRNQAIPWRPLLPKQGMNNANPSPAAYVTQSNQLRSSPIPDLNRPANPQARQPTLEELKRYFQDKSNVRQAPNPLRPTMQRPILAQSPNPGQANLSVQQVHSLRPATPQMPSSDANISTFQVLTFNGHAVVKRSLGPDTETAVANQISKDVTNETVTPAKVTSQPSPQPPSRSSSVDSQSQDSVQRRASVNDQSEQPLQASGSDTNNPDESEDEGLGLNGFSESDSVRDMLKDIPGTKKVLEKLAHLVPKEDIRQLLEKAKINHKEQIDKWTNEYEAAARLERHKYLEFENLRQKIEREQENAKKLCENIVKWKKEAEKVRTEKTEAAKRKSDYQNKIAEENEKIPVINECITMFTGQTPQ